MLQFPSQKARLKNTIYVLNFLSNLFPNNNNDHELEDDEEDFEWENERKILLLHLQLAVMEKAADFLSAHEDDILAAVAEAAPAVADAVGALAGYVEQLFRPPPKAEPGTMQFFVFWELRCLKNLQYSKFMNVKPKYSLYIMKRFWNNPRLETFELAGNFL